MNIRISHADVLRFADWSGDRNPLHVDPAAARQSFFGRPVVHGMLSTIEALTAAGVTKARTIDIEFRGALFPDTDTTLERTRGDQGITLALRDGNHVVMIVRALAEPSDAIDITSADLPSDGGLRKEPAVREIGDFIPGTLFSGVYPDPAEPEHISSFSPGAARILALCSYVVGMEVPGLRSLFTRATITFGDSLPSRGELRYRVEIVRFDPQFRILETRLAVATADGVPAASATLRSYVRFTPVQAAVHALEQRFASRPLGGKIALVCGGTRGLGADLTAALAAAGCTVYASYHNDSDAAVRLERQLAESGLRAELLQGDAGDTVWCSSAVERVARTHGRLDLLVLNACAPPISSRLGSVQDDQNLEYIARNLRLARAPLTAALGVLERSAGAIVAMSSSFVEEAPAGFADYIALKEAVESLVRAGVREAPRVAAIIARPPRLQTTWNDTPSGVVGTIPSVRVAEALVSQLADGWRAGDISILNTFPEGSTTVSGATEPRPECTVSLASSFTADGIARGLSFLLNELKLKGAVDVAPYGQILQTLLNPAASAPKRGLNAVLLRVRDWLRELPEDRSRSIDSVREHVNRMVADLERALRTHRTHARADTLVVLCPSDVDSGSSDEVDAALVGAEHQLVQRLPAVPGVLVVQARDHHSAFGVKNEQVPDPVRDEIAHIPYQDGYLYYLSALVARYLHRSLSPARKVVVVDCDNTLWRGVVGEVGAEGIELDASHRALQDRLAALSAGGVLVCLCSKNEEEDVWRVFEARSDLRLRREQIVASMINWGPKSENLRRLASRLNLGLDSFIFIDDNPVECAEVRAACPEVLTLEWPTRPEEAIQLLHHAWELLPGRSTAEDARRTEMYREEFRRQELQDTLSFGEFLETLQLVVEARALDSADLKRASQLTLRTNQFNFTTLRRSESDLRALVEDGRHILRTVRVRDRFGDYGLVGLLILAPSGDVLELDTFLLSCRVLGRGVEHQLAADLGRTALDLGLRAVRFRVDFTKRNTPARAFVRAIVPEDYRVETATSLECEVPAALLADLKFEPTAPAAAADEADDSAAVAPGAADAVSLRERERQIARIVGALSTVDGLRAAIDGKPAAQPAHWGADVSGIVYEAFASALGLTPARIKEVDALEALGCDSFKIVEITVALIERFPTIPPTLLFEYKSVSEIVNALAAASSQPSAPAIVAPRSYSRGERNEDEGIAVVGMHARCAGASSPEELWQLLSRGEVAVREVPGDRSGFLHPLADSRPHFAGLLDDVARFDAELFGVAPREAEVMDPQLRLFLETAWGALEDAGCLGGEHDAQTGVFAGVMYGDYAPHANIAVRSKELPYRSWENFSLANRLSQLLGFHGPSLAVDTACSSSATALHFACRALAARDCNVAVVGGVNLILDPDRFVHLGRLGILSMAGRCLAFGADADGTILGEGAGAVVLRRLSDARHRGDRILGVIKGTGVSTGSGTVGFTAPNPQAQAEAIRRALEAARLDPRTISYVETHGTGTSLGDPIEVRGLTLAYSAPELRDPALDAAADCAIGSIKPNIGHLEAGAGVIGLIKILLQMQHRQLLPSVTSERPNPQIPFSDTPFRVQRSLEEWRRRQLPHNGATIEIPRRAALSSFGVGGANVHIVLEEPPETTSAADATERPAHLLALSAKNETALRARAGQLSAWLKDHVDVPLPNAFFSANTGRRQLAARAGIVANSREQTIAALDQVAAAQRTKAATIGTVESREGRPRLAFLFTGQGSQHARMGAALYETQPVFRGALDRCAAIFDRLLGKPLLSLLFAEPDSEDALLLNQTGFTQPALFAYEYALAELWASWGVTPDFVMGHSVGEISAMCVAGGVSLEDGLALIAARGSLMQALPAGGGMASVMADEATVQDAISGRDNLAIAAINGPRQIVISGDGAALSDVVEQLRERGVKATPLTVSHAFHSPLIRPMIAEYSRVLERISFSRPHVPLVTGVHGRIGGDEIARPDYWTRNVLDPVRFTSGIGELVEHSCRVFLEIGPQPTLVGMARQSAPDGFNAHWIASARRDADPWTTLLGAAAQLHVAGVDLDWKAFDAPYNRRRVSIPAYPFGGKRHWIARDDVAIPVGRAGAAAQSQPASDAHPQSYEVTWTTQAELMPAMAATGGWIVFAGASGIGAEIVRALEERGARCTVAFSGEEFAAIGGSAYQLDPVNREHIDRLLRDVAGTQPIRGIVSTWPADQVIAEANGTPEGAHALLAHAVNLAAAANQQGHRPPVWLVTRGAVACGENAPVSLSQAPLWGLGRTIAIEAPEIWGGLIDLSHEANPNDPASVVTELVSQSAEDQVAFRSGRRLVPRLGAASPGSTRTIAFRADATYLVTGGTGAIGQRLCRWLVERGARRLVVTARRGEQAPAAQALSAAIARLGGHVRILAADVSNPHDVDRIFAALLEDGPAGGVFHLAGIDSSRPLTALSADDLCRVAAPKIVGSWMLHERSRSLNLEYFVCFSSIASVLGAAGRAHYAAANAFQDALAHERHRNGLPATTVNWGPWKGGGMASADVLEQFERIGNHGLDPDRAIEEFERALAGGRPQTSIAAIDWPRFRQAYEARRPRPLVSPLGGAAPSAVGSQSEEAPWLQILKRLSPEEREAQLVRLLQQEVADTLGYDVDNVGIVQSFTDLGMDSLMSAEFAQRIQKQLGTRSTALVFEHPRISSLAPRLLERVDLSPTALQSPPRLAEREDAPARPAPEVQPGTARAIGVTAPAAHIVGYSQGIEPLVYAFQETAFPQRRRDWIAPRWNWMFVESARRLGLDPQVWLYRDNGRIAGHNGAIPVRLKISDRERDTAWLVDTMVLEEYRGQAVGARLMVQAHEDLPFALSLGQTQQMRDIQLRLGWENVAPLQTAQYLIRPERVLKGKLPAGVDAAAGLGLRAANAVRDVFKNRAIADTREIDGFGPRHDRLWERMASTVTCAVKRDASYLNWKYVQQPGQRFIRLELGQSEQVRAVAVLSIREPDDVYRYTRAFLVDVVAPVDDSRLLDRLIQASVHAALNAGADALTCLHISQPLTAALKRAGFRLRRPERFLLVRPGDVDERSRQCVLSPESWFVTQGDSDIDRPW